MTSKSSGDLALAELAAGHRFDAIVTDFAMPGMNGLELLKMAHEMDQQMKGIIITGLSHSEVLSDLAHVTMLRKRLNRAELIESVFNMIAAKRFVVDVITLAND